MTTLMYAYCLILVCTLLIGGCSKVQETTLLIQARIIYDVGRLQPAAGTPFYLLDVDPFSLNEDDLAPQNEDALKTELEKVARKVGLTNFFLLRYHAYKKTVFPYDDAKAFLGAVKSGRPLWGPHLIKEVTTDSEGRAKFEGINPGTYWLLGQCETSHAFTLWNVSVDVSQGPNAFLLDQDNALYSN